LIYIILKDLHNFKQKIMLCFWIIILTTVDARAFDKEGETKRKTEKERERESDREINEKKERKKHNKLKTRERESN
jgi:hypothetical protein